MYELSYRVGKANSNARGAHDARYGKMRAKECFAEEVP